MRIEDRINRWRQLYNSNPKKTIVRYIINYPGPADDVPILSAANRQARVDWAKRLYEWQIHNFNSYEDDSLPYLFALSGTEIFAECFGCKIVYPNNSRPFALPFIFDSAGAGRLKTPNLEDTPLILLFEMVDELKRFAGDTALVKLSDIQCPIDVTALIWDKNELFLAMVDEPEAILELAEKVRELQICFLDEWFKRYGVNYIAHCPDYYIEEGITMSVDEIGSVSPEMFRQFFRDEINILSRRYGGVGIHSCANSIKQWENLRQIENLKVLNLHREWEQLREAFVFFRDTCAQMHSRADGQNIMPGGPNSSLLPDKSRVVLTVQARDYDHARKLATQYAAEYM